MADPNERVRHIETKCSIIFAYNTKFDNFLDTKYNIINAINTKAENSQKPTNNIVKNYDPENFEVANNFRME